MKLTTEQRAELKARAIADRRETFTAYTVLDLLADLEEAERKAAYGAGIKADLDHTAELLRISEAELAATRRQLAEAQARLAHVNGCFEAASDEGLFERIAEVGHAYGDGSLADLVQRRLLHDPKTDPHSTLQSAIEQARREEREACLKAADEAYATEHVLRAIRAHNEK